ncbi:MAG: gephyrin-like molybdotransferase Glp [Aestuariibacter sp.]
MDNCAAPGLIPLPEALNKQLEKITATRATEVVPIDKALDRIIALPARADVNVPPTDNSAMDGYAICLTEDTSHSSYRLVGDALAGHPFQQKVSLGETVRIMTGATIPEGANCVIMQENSTVEGDQVTFSDGFTVGKNIRPAGSDIQKGSQLIDAGTRLTAAHLAMIASLGIASVTVYKKLKVGVVSTGDELQQPGNPLAEGQLYESNRFGLKAMLARLPIEVIDYGILPDEPEVIERVFLTAARECDWLLSSGGVSVGDADYVKQVLDKIGDIGFWKVAIKPGKPYAFGKIHECWFSGLPGNPVSTFVTFLQLVVPCLRVMAGEQAVQTQKWRAKLTKTIRRRAGRLDFQRGIFEQRDDGSFVASPCAQQSSGVMTSFLQANCFILLPADAAQLEENCLVEIIPFDRYLD